MLLATNPLLSAVDELAAGCHMHFAMVDSKLTSGIDGEVTAKLTLAIDPPPSRRGNLTVTCVFDAGDTMALRTSRELETEQQWLPENVTLRLKVEWSATWKLDAHDADPEELLAVAMDVPLCAEDAHAWARKGEVYSSRAAALGATGPGVDLVVGLEDRLTLPQVHSRDWQAFAAQLAELVSRLHAAAVAE